MQVHWTLWLSNVRLHLWIFKNGISFFFNLIIIWKLRKLRWYHAFCWAIGIVLINWIIQNHIGMRISFCTSIWWYANIKLLPILIINLLLLHNTRIAHFFGMIFNFWCFHIIFYFYTISFLFKVFFFAYRLILDIKSATGLFLFRKDFWLLGMNVLMAWNSFNNIHFLSVNLCCGFLEAYSNISLLLIGKQFHDIVIGIFVFA